MRLSHGKILLSSQKEHELNLPIDLFFHSLAEEAGSKAIAVVLSGTGSDGSNGIKAIKESEGLILVQDVESAKFDGMPRSAIRTGTVDAELSPEKIALEIAHISNTSIQVPESFKNETEVDEELMKKVYIILRKISNINFTHYKQTTIIRRIERRMMLTHKETLNEYVEYLYECPDEVKTLSKEVLIGVTSFFRDPEFFQLLKERAIQDILVRSTEDETVRVWVAGCSTGEEAYSIAILFQESMESLKIKRNVKIFATDLDVESITVAGKGVYSDNIIENVSAVRLSRFFTRQNNSYLVNRDLRKMIVFSPHNVFQDPPFGRLDLISCRNMLIYFQPVLQNDLFGIFHSALKDNGYLFLGKSEAIGAFTEAFPVVDATAKIFTHHSDVKISGAKTIPFLQTPYIDDEISDDITNRYSPRVNTSSPKEDEDESIDSNLLEQFMPACVVVNDKNEIIHTYGENSNFLHFSLGKFSNIIFDVITDALKVPVSTILKEARNKHQKIQYSNICIVGEKEKAVIDLTALPISRRAKNNVNNKEIVYGLIFSDNQSRVDDSNAVPYEIDRIAAQRITDLEQELGDVQGKLDRSVAEQECVNEELQAANEELLTANEELQSSNEELQSVNEELYTVNSEYQQKLSELADLNDDIANFLSSTLIGIIFVDNKLNIRRYTDYVTTEFSVMDHDIGRSLKFISYHFPTVDISEICDNVLKTLVPDEREITTSKKKVFFMRVAPYRSTENKILGCVITLVDITTQKLGLAKLQNTEERLSLFQQASVAKNDYLARIIQEIAEPLKVISQYTLQAKKNVKENDIVDTELDKITSTVNYVTSIVNDISTTTSNNFVVVDHVSKPFVLKQLMENVINSVSNRASKNNIKINLLLDDNNSQNYMGNENAVQEILDNFITHFIENTKKNGTIILKVFEVDHEDKYVSLCFVISDSLLNVSCDEIPDLFKPEMHSKNGTYSENTSKLGLSIAYNLIQAMDGTVNISNNEIEGTIVSIRLKIQKDAPEVTSSKSVVSFTLARKHVLIAEDNALNRMVLCSMIKKEGMTYSEAEDGEQAIKQFIESPAHTFDCILMDMRMPKMDGIRAAQIIRDSQKPDAKLIPIIGVSANGFSEDIKKARDAGINDYISKPIEKDQLFTIMKKHLDSMKH